MKKAKMNKIKKEILPKVLIKILNNNLKTKVMRPLKNGLLTLRQDKQ